jgi:tetratricopeptide (TPR) repeat protein
MLLRERHVNRKAWCALAVIVAGAITIVAPARAGDPLYVAKCNDWGGKRFSIEERIDGCTAIISSGRYGRKNLARAYNNRGFAWTAKGDLDRATADFDEAVRLDPKLPLRNSKRRPPSVK